MLKTLTGLLLIAHGLVHWVLVAPHPDVADSGFAGFLKHSWLVGNLGLNEAVARWLGIRTSTIACTSEETTEKLLKRLYQRQFDSFEAGRF